MLAEVANELRNHFTKRYPMYAAQGISIIWEPIPHTLPLNCQGVGTGEVLHQCDKGSQAAILGQAIPVHPSDDR